MNIKDATLLAIQFITIKIMEAEILIISTREKKEYKAIILILFSFLLLESSFGQTDLISLLRLAETNYPVIIARQAESEAALALVALEKNTMLPSLDAAYQANYSTYNNITGMSYPGLLLPISGPPTPGNFNNPVPGSSVSLLLKWTPLTFGQRKASVEFNRKLYEKQLVGVEDEVLRVKFHVAFLYLEIASTREIVKASQKNIERNEFNLKQAYSLVSAGIRPVVDSLRFKGELSKARSELYKLENLLETQKQELQEFLSTDKMPEIETNEFFVNNLPAEPTYPSGAVENPVLKMARFELEYNQAQLKQISRSWTPKLEFWGTSFARGSGINYDGMVNEADGWSFSRYNYGVGLQVAFPILDITNVRMKANRMEAIIRSSESYLKHTQITLSRQEANAINDLKTSLLLANEVPVEYEASEYAFNALQIRYNSGLIDYYELIQAQYGLLNAESSLKITYISSWKSLLKLAVIRGDINIFLNQIKN